MSIGRKGTREPGSVIVPGFVVEHKVPVAPGNPGDPGNPGKANLATIPGVVLWTVHRREQVAYIEQSSYYVATLGPTHLWF